MEIFTFYSEQYKANLVYEDFLLIFSPIRFKYKHFYIGNQPKGKYDLVITTEKQEDDPRCIERAVRLYIEGHVSQCDNTPLEEETPCVNLPEVKKPSDFLKKKVEEVKAEDSNVENIFRKLQVLKRSK